ncbi:ACT domain-containing protein [Sphingomonas sp. PAMC 26617]|uniref:ACT domain-containing protein n=1 Tax=Sphingomonas sp. PAMC 26617 TaxID=1112216 RepID=UPI000498077B|nr:ACT domain-containing protein [Sphingomonas sp. PAMC 26617]
MTQNLVRERQAMLAGMKPVLKEGAYFFCTTNDGFIAAALLRCSLAIFREDEGVAIVLIEDDARQHGFDVSMPMRRIVLEVYSALDGVGLTAGVATALADDGIPCNMIAAYHHDNVFVPASMAERAIRILQDVQREAASAER